MRTTLERHDSRFERIAPGSRADGRLPDFPSSQGGGYPARTEAPKARSGETFFPGNAAKSRKKGPSAPFRWGGGGGEGGGGATCDPPITPGIASGAGEAFFRSDV